MVGESKLHHSNPGTWFVVTYLGVCGCFPEFLERAPWCTLGCRRKGCMGCARVVQLGLCRLLVGELSALLKRPQCEPNGIYTHTGAQYKVCESIWRITVSLQLFHLHSFRLHKSVCRFCTADRPTQGKSCHLRGHRAPLDRCGITQTQLILAKYRQHQSFQSSESVEHSPNAVS
jgi:hypothetical protein